MLYFSSIQFNYRFEYMTMTEKPANTITPIHPLLAKRWSSRAIDTDAALEQEQIIALLEAARWAPSCYGAQPWQLLVCERERQQTPWEQVFSCLSSGNQHWAAAPLFVVFAADTLFSHNQQPNRWGQYDSGAAAENLCLQASAMDLVAHQMGGFDEVALAQYLRVPERYALMAVVAVGKKLPLGEMDEELQAREQAPRQRNPLGQNTHAGYWGEPLSYLGEEGNNE